MAANVTAFTNWSATASSNQPDGSDAADIDADMRQIQAEVRKYTRTKGSDIASASTVDLANATGDYIDITGTTTITSFGTVSAGMRFILQFDDALTLTHNGTSLVLPGAANITTAAGDHAILESLGSGNWRCVAYSRASGLPFDAELSAIAGLTSAANKFPMFSGSGTATLIDFKDEDNMASNSATAVPSQQSVKAYADTKDIATQVAPSTSGNVLTSNGSAWISSAPSGTLLVGGSDTSVSAGGTTITGLPSDARIIHVAFVNVDLSTSDEWGIQLGDSGGIETSGYYGVSSSASGGTRRVWSTYAGVSYGLPSGKTHSGMITLIRHGTTNTWAMHGEIASTNGTDNDMSRMAGYKTLSATLTQLKIVAAGGSFSGGSISLNYIRD